MRNLTKIVFVILLFLFSIFSVSIAQQEENTFINKIAFAVRTSYPPEIDGIINDSVWFSAIPVSDFMQEEPLPGSSPSFNTEVRILYDDENLYVSFMCYDDEPEKIIARELKLDGKWSGDDNIAILFDTFNDDRNAYWFGTNPLGMRDDALLNTSSGFNEDWHGIWLARSSIVDSGWSTEIIFPFFNFKFNDTVEQNWGVNFQRHIQRKGESVQWTAYEKDLDFFKIAFAGSLLGIKNISRGKPVYLKPFFTAGVQKNPAAETYVYKPGLDIKYGITETLSLDLTFNTDFAQVESDRAIINLTRFPILFPEKRDFFIEGAGVFSFPIGGINNLFYSRRIGISNGKEIPIVAGAKLVGREDKTEIGVLNMQTASKGTEPAANYGVARIKYDLFKQSYAGIFFSNKISKSGFNRVYAGDVVLTTSEFLGDKTITFGSGIMKSDEKNGAKNSWAAKFYIDYPNDLINQFFTYRFIQENFNPEIGFITRHGIQEILYNFRLNPRVNWGEIKKLNFVPIESQFNFNRNNDLLASTLSFQPFGISDIYGDEIGFVIQRSFDNVESDFEIFNNVVIPKERYWFNDYSIEFETASSRDIYGGLAASIGDFYNGNKKSLSSEITWTVNKNLSLNADFLHNNISLPQGKFITNELGSRLRYDFSTMLYSSIFAQWNNELNELNINYRINWQPNVGSNFYLVVNHLLSTSNKLKSEDFTLLAKIVWLIII